MLTLFSYVHVSGWASARAGESAPGRAHRTQWSMVLTAANGGQTDVQEKLSRRPSNGRFSPINALTSSSRCDVRNFIFECSVATSICSSTLQHACHARDRTSDGRRCTPHLRVLDRTSATRRTHVHIPSDPNKPQGRCACGREYLDITGGPGLLPKPSC